MSTSSVSQRGRFVPRVGAIVADKYRIERKLGEGGMGLANHRDFCRHVTPRPLKTRVWATRSTAGSSCTNAVLSGRTLTPSMFLLGVFTLVILSAPATAHAESRSTAVAAVAEGLFKEGKKLLAERQIPEACRKFESSYRIDPAGATLLQLALCHEQEGKLATAWDEFNEAVQVAKKDNRGDRVKMAREHISAIEPLLSRYVVIAPEDAAKIGLAVEMDGIPLEEGVWGTAIPIDAGDHKATAHAPKFKSWEKTITVEHGKVATVLIPQLERLQSAAPKDAGGKWKKPVGFSALGLSAVLFGVGGYLGGRALSFGSEVNAECENLVCNAATWQKIEAGRRAALASNLLIGFGLVSAGAGAFFLATAPSSPKARPPATAHFQFSIGPSATYVGIGGTF